MAPYSLLHRLALFCVLFLIVDVQATCKNPSVRREWRKLSKKQRTEWIDAIRCLNNLPHDPVLTPSVNTSISAIPPLNPNSSYWDDIVYVHMDLNPEIHFTGFFLPFHRAYVWGVEKALKTKCGYKGVQPYWDWTIDAPDFYHATIFNNDSESGFGGWGDPAADYQITTGGFAKNFTVTYPLSHRVRRNFTVQPFLGASLVGGPSVDPNEYINTTFTKNNTDYNINSFDGDFVGFQGYLEGPGPHSGPHLIMGGDLAGNCPTNAPPTCSPGSKWTPNDPLFFMHHAMIDKIWYDWQHRNETNRNAFKGGSISTITNGTLYAEYPNGAPPYLNVSSIIPGDGLLWDNLTVSDMMDTMSGCLCYTYE